MIISASNGLCTWYITIAAMITFEIIKPAIAAMVRSAYIGMQIRMEDFLHPT